VFAALDGDSIIDFQDGVDFIDLRGTDAVLADLIIATDGTDIYGDLAGWYPGPLS